MMKKPLSERVENWLLMALVPTVIYMFYLLVILPPPEQKIKAVVEQQYKVRMFYSPEGTFYVHHTVPMSEVPGMQVVIVSNEQEGGAKYMFLAPATTTFTVGEEVQPVSISYSQHYLKHAGYQTVLKKK
jgi:hypothetical protein